MAGHVTKRGNRYRARFPDPLGGGTQQIERTFKAKGAADEWLDGMRHSARSGAYINPNDGARSFALVAEEYRTTWADLEPRTKAGYAHILRLHLLPRFGSARVSAVSTDAVQRYVNELAARLAPNTVRRIYGVLRGVLQTATERRYLAANPCDAVRLPKKRQAKGANGADSADERMIFLTPSEVAQLVQAMPEHYRTATWVAAYCGLRAGELWALRRKDVDLLTGTLYVRQALKEVNGGDAIVKAEGRAPAEEGTRQERGLIFGPPKSKASRRRMTLPAPIKALLAEHLSRSLPGGDGPDALIFTTPSGLPMRHGLFYRRVFSKARVALPAPKSSLRWHDLRHTAASLSLAVTPSLHLVKERLGHEDIRTTINTYGHLLPSVEEGLNDGLAALFAGADTTAPDNVVELPLHG